MVETEIISNMLGISPRASSKRLIFVKESELADRWHICDFTDLVEDPDKGGRLLIIALHGLHVPKVVEASSINELSLKELGLMALCSDCVDEFKECFDGIQSRPEWAFTDPK